MKYNSVQNIIIAIVGARKAKNLTQTELGKKLGLPQSYISKLESGKLDARLSSILEIARYLNVEIFLVPTVLAPIVDSLLAGKTGQESPLYRIEDGESESLND